MKILFVILLLILPAWMEVYRDRKGDSHPNNDWQLRTFFCLISGVFSALLLPLSTYLIDLARYVAISGLWFSVIFPYWINYVHLKNGVTSYHKLLEKRYTGMGIEFISRRTGGLQWSTMTSEEKFDHIVNHMSDTAWPDRIVWWRQLGWKCRAIVNAVLLCISIIIWAL